MESADKRASSQAAPTAPEGPAEQAHDGLRERLAAYDPDQLVLQDFRPLTQTLDWELSSYYWESSALSSFLGGDVPYLANCDGRTAEDAARLWITALHAADSFGQLEPVSYGLEIGAGSGLFARLLLDAIRRLDPWSYERVCLVVTDAAPQMLDDAAAAGVFSGHEGKITHVVADAGQLAASLEPMLADVRASGGFRAIFANYILDCLPATVLRRTGVVLEELRFRTSIASDTRLADYADLTLDEVRRCVDSGDPAERRKLLALYRTLVLDARFEPVEEPKDRGASFPLPAGHNAVAVDSYGAVECLAECAGLLRRGGFFLLSDYGFVGNGPKLVRPVPERLGGSFTIGVNFDQLQRAAGLQGLSWAQPELENEHLLVRLCGKDLDRNVSRAFMEVTSGARFAWLRQPLNEARELVSLERLPLARAAFVRALERQPFNWVLLEEVAQFLTYQVRQYDLALEFAMRGLELNPLGAGLWNIIGDCHFFSDRLEEAGDAYEKAVEIDANDPRGHYNLVCLWVRQRAFARALVRIAELFPMTGVEPYMPRLLERQREALSALDEMRTAEQALMLDRLRLPPDLLSPEQSNFAVRGY